jgi:hypothetical protein
MGDGEIPPSRIASCSCTDIEHARLSRLFLLLSLHLLGEAITTPLLSQKISPKKSIHEETIFPTGMSSPWPRIFSAAIIKKETLSSHRFPVLYRLPMHRSETPG